MALQRYDVESAERPGVWEVRYWSPVNRALLGPDRRVVLLIHRVEEVTELIRARGGRDGDRARVLEAELYSRARELQKVNERLRQAHARKREVALALQKAMLPTPRDSFETPRNGDPLGAGSSRLLNAPPPARTAHR